MSTFVLFILSVLLGLEVLLLHYSIKIDAKTEKILRKIEQLERKD